MSEGIFHSNVKGDAKINGIAIQNLAEQINAHQANALNSLEVFNRDYAETCHKMQYLIQKTQTLPYFLSHFEEAFSLRFPNVLNSVHFFEGNSGQNYVVINLACVTVLYAWNRNAENFEKVVETETGNVDSWLDMMDETNVIHLISNTGTDRTNCPTSGLNVWKFDGKSLAHVSQVTDAKKFSSLHLSKLHPQRFLAMTKDDGVVNAFDLENNLVEQWHLPMNDQQFQFVPESANLGIALSNGKQLSSLSYTQPADNRKGRSIGSFALNDLMELKRTVRCPFLEEKLANATANCKLWHQAKLKALSNIGPYKHLDATTQNRLIKNVNMSNIQLGSSPFKLTIIPSERGPFMSSKLKLTKKNRQQSTIDAEPSVTPEAGNEQLIVGKPPLNSTARDAFGDIEKAATDLADNVVDSLIEVDADEEDVDFDDSLIGSSLKDESKIESKPVLNSIRNDSQPPTSSRDMFGDIEAKTIKLTDKVMDVVENFKDNAKESQAKFHNMFQVKPMNNGHFRGMEKNSDDQKNEHKNLPKIPKVVYTTNDTDSQATQSPPMYGTDGIDQNAAVDNEFPEGSTAATTTTTVGFTTNFPPEDVGALEPKISKEIFSEGIATAENLNFPQHPAEEIVGITIGENKKHLVAVSSLQEHTIQGKHDLIRVRHQKIHSAGPKKNVSFFFLFQIYEDIIEGNLFQTLVCHRPRSLTVLNLRDETILAFIENDADVQVRLKFSFSFC